MIALGRIGINMVRRLQKASHHCVVYDINAETVQRLDGATGQHYLKELRLCSEQAPAALQEGSARSRQPESQPDRENLFISSPSVILGRVGSECLRIGFQLVLVMCQNLIAYVIQHLPGNLLLEIEYIGIAIRKYERVPRIGIGHGFEVSPTSTPAVIRSAGDTIDAFLAEPQDTIRAMSESTAVSCDNDALRLWIWNGVLGRPLNFASEFGSNQWMNGLVQLKSVSGDSKQMPLSILIAF